jgi:hypothetical protein
VRHSIELVVSALFFIGACGLTWHYYKRGSSLVGAWIAVSVVDLLIFAKYLGVFAISAIQVVNQ